MGSILSLERRLKSSAALPALKTMKSLPLLARRYLEAFTTSSSVQRVPCLAAASDSKGLGRLWPASP